MGSERMPGKVLKELSGIPSLVHIFRILSKSKLTDDFVVVTTSLSEDDPIETICHEHKVRCYRGSVHDVLDRFRMAAAAEKPDNIIRVTGDDPLMDPEIIDKVISEHIEGGYDYSSNMIERTYPRGMDTEVVRYETLEYAWKTTADKDDREHVTLYVRRHPEKFTMHSVVREGESLDHIRLCLDTEEDYKLISGIYNNIYNGDVIALDEVLKLISENPELLKLNEMISQKPVKGKIY
jgi:spore coat polysaccharide biosynthesis protein SpsF